MAEEKSQLTYDFNTGTLSDSAGKPVDVASLSEAPKTSEAPKPTVSDIRTKRLLKAALDPYYR